MNYKELRVELNISPFIFFKSLVQFAPTATPAIMKPKTATANFFILNPLHKLDFHYIR